MEFDELTEIWQLRDAITTVVEANGYSIYDLQHAGGCFRLELREHITDEAASRLCGQFTLQADYYGEGPQGTTITLYHE